jgi:hypothetical protein
LRCDGSDQNNRGSPIIIEVPYTPIIDRSSYMASPSVAVPTGLL